MYDVYGAWRGFKKHHAEDAPFVLEKVFLNESDAVNYINQQPGANGEVPEIGWADSGKMDWVVRPMQVLEHLGDGPAYVRRKIIENALAKLSGGERKALGL